MDPIEIGVLAIQGDYEMHLKTLERAGAWGRKVRLPRDLEGLRGLILPGGESTTMVKLAKDYGLFEELRRAGARGLPMFGTCAGAILLGCASGVGGDSCPERLGLVPVTVRRNAYGRQRESFERPMDLHVALPDRGGEGGRKFTCIFIRAPKIDPPQDPEVEVLARDGDDPILLRYRNFLLATFHPELTADGGIHRLFLEMCGK
jgi:pyridoxal 5'-phosphate synthase pdxT subunit